MKNEKQGIRSGYKRSKPVSDIVHAMCRTEQLWSSQTMSTRTGMMSVLLSMCSHVPGRWKKKRSGKTQNLQ